jgi:hypothetical protein
MFGARVFYSLAIVLALAMLGARAVRALGDEGRAALPASAPSTREAAQLKTLQEKLQESRELDGRIRGLPSLGSFRRDDVFRIHKEGNRLVLQTSLHATMGGERQVTIEDLPGPTSVSVRDPLKGNEPREGLRVPLLFQLFHLDASDPDAVFCYASVAAMPGHLIIGGDYQLKNGSRSVQFVEERRAGDPRPEANEEGDRLFIKEFDNDDRIVVDLTLRGPDLETLKVRHPREVSRYLRPVLRDLGHESLLAVSPQVAWQVFAPDVQPDPAIRAKVLQLLPELGAQSFRQRQAATQALKDLGDPGALVLMRLDPASMAEEQRARIQELLAAYRTLSSEQIAALRQDGDFLLDCVNSESAELRAAALEALKQKLGRTVELPADARARATAIAELRKQLSPLAVQAPATNPSTGPSAAPSEPP